LSGCETANGRAALPAHERAALLREGATAIGTTLDVMRTAQELADLAVPLLADYATVDLADVVPLDEQPLANLPPVNTCIPTFRRGGVASIHLGYPESLSARGAPVYVPKTSSFTEVLTSGKPQLRSVLNTSPGTWLDQDPARLSIIRETGMHSMMMLPIHSRGAVLGVVTLIRTDNPMPFTEDDLLLTEELLGWAALQLDNARLHRLEHTIVRALQRSLRPLTLNGGTALEVASRYLPVDTHTSVGGDWFDIIPLSGNRVAMVVGDVVGHGINAATAMGRVRTAVHTLATMDLPPDELLTHLDAVVLRLTESEYLSAECPPSTVLGATCLYAIYDPATRHCTMARAGHVPPAIRTPDGVVTYPDMPSGAPLGLGLHSFQAIDLELPEGSIIALYTDGLIETHTQDIDEGMRRLATALTEPQPSMDDFCAQAISIVDANPTDDIALLLVRTRARGIRSGRGQPAVNT
jgi:serine phosphatase RsbU (regulator of sigma subunit)